MSPVRPQIHVGAGIDKHVDIAFKPSLAATCRADCPWLRALTSAPAFANNAKPSAVRFSDRALVGAQQAIKRRTPLFVQRVNIRPSRDEQLCHGS